MDNQKIHLLLVEDNEDHAELIIRTLSRLETLIAVHHVSDGESAMEYLQHRGQFSSPKECPQPTLILLDLRLPRLDGLSVLKKVKESEKLRLIPTVILTSSESETDIYNAYSNHVNSFLVKPMDGIQFTSLIREIEQYWLTLNTPMAQ
ncbi:MAG: response regulator [Ignavibacteriales bacterium]